MSLSYPHVRRWEFTTFGWWNLNDSPDLDRAQLTSLVTSHWKCYVYIINVHDHLFLASCSLWLHHFLKTYYIHFFLSSNYIYIYMRSVYSIFMVKSSHQSTGEPTWVLFRHCSLVRPTMRCYVWDPCHKATPWECHRYPHWSPKIPVTGYDVGKTMP